MTTEQEYIEQICLSVSENRSIDWSQYEDLKSNHPELWQRLRKIEAIAKTMQDTLQVEEEHTETALFNWGHLSVLERIGEGNFGEVFRAFDSILEREVALKLIKPKRISGHQTRSFIEETRRMAKVRHPRVLAIHGANIHDARVGFWCDLISGDSLSDGKDKQYSPDQILLYAIDLAEALHAVHEAGLVHGDVKLSNIMSDHMQRLILMDFGAGAHQDQVDANDLNVVGTPLYMAPELFQGEAKSPASDMYAFGVVLYRLCTQNYPLHADDVDALMQAHQNQHPIPTLRLARPDISRPMAQLIHGLLSPEPHARPDAKTVKEQLDYIRKTPERKRKKWAIGSIIASLCIGLLAVSVAYVNVDNARLATLQEKQKTDSVNDFLSQLLNSASALGRAREVRVVDLLQVASSSLDEKFSDQPMAKAAMYHALGNSYNSLRLPEKALTYLQKSLDLKRSLLQENDPEILRTLIEVAFSKQVLRAHDESIALFKEVIALAESQQPPNENTIAVAKIRMADIYLDLDEISTAEELLQGLTEQLPDPKTAENNTPFLALSILSTIHVMKSEYDKSEEVSRKAMAWLNAFPKAMETNKNAIRTELANALAQQGKLDEAEELYIQDVEQTARLFGPDNRANIPTLANFSAFLRKRNKTEEALEYGQRAYELSKSYGPRDLYTMRSAVTLANILVDLDRKAEGETLMRNTLNDVYATMGENHQLAFLLEYNLGELLNNTQRYAEAYALATSTYQKALEKFGENHIYTLASSDNIGFSLSGQGQHEAALSRLKTTLQQLQETQGPSAPITLLSQRHLAESYERAELIEQSLSTFQALLAIQKEHLEESHEDVKLTESDIERLQNMRSTQ